MVIRVADAKDAEQAALVLRRSIEELCVLDHGGEEQTLRMWLNNKTPENVRTWITSPTQHILLAEENGNLLGVGGASSAGEITLNYVAPEARFKGVSKSILAALESYLHDLGYGESKLTSTQTAHSFYLAVGYEDAGLPEYWSNMRGQPMRRVLVWHKS